MQMEEEGVPSTTLREISLLKMLSESNHIVKCAAMRFMCCKLMGDDVDDAGWGGVPSFACTHHYVRTTHARRLQVAVRRARRGEQQALLVSGF